MSEEVVTEVVNPLTQNLMERWPFALGVGAIVGVVVYFILKVAKKDKLPQIDEYFTAIPSVGDFQKSLCSDKKRKKYDAELLKMNKSQMEDKKTQIKKNVEEKSALQTKERNEKFSQRTSQANLFDESENSDSDKSSESGTESDDEVQDEMFVEDLDENIQNIFMEAFAYTDFDEFLDDFEGVPLQKIYKTNKNDFIDLLQGYIDDQFDDGIADFEALAELLDKESQKEIYNMTGNEKFSVDSKGKIKGSKSVADDDESVNEDSIMDDEDSEAIVVSKKSKKSQKYDSEEDEEEESDNKNEEIEDLIVTILCEALPNADEQDLQDDAQNKTPDEIFETYRDNILDLIDELVDDGDEELLEKIREFSDVLETDENVVEILDALGE